MTFTSSRTHFTWSKDCKEAGEQPSLCWSRATSSGYGHWTWWCMHVTVLRRNTRSLVLTLNIIG